MNASVTYGPYRLRAEKRAGKLTGKWVVDIPRHIAGRRRREFFANREEATKFAKALCEPNRLSAASTQHDVREFFFPNVVKDWLVAQRVRVQTSKKRQSSLDKDEAVLVSLQRFLGFVSLRQITEERISDYQAFRLGAGRKPETVNTDISVLMKILRWAFKKGMLQVLPDVEPIPETAKGREHVPTPEEMGRIIAAMPKRHRVLIRFLAETGCRSGEARNLRWENIDLVEGTVSIRPHGQWTPKTRHSNRDLRLSKGLLAELAQMPRTSDFVFPSKRNPAKPVGRFYKSFGRAVAKANVRRGGKQIRVTPHTLRKAYATWAAQEVQLDQAHLQYLLGHSPGSKATAKHYIKTPDTVLRRGVLELSVPFEPGLNVAASGSKGLKRPKKAPLATGGQNG